MRTYSSSLRHRKSQRLSEELQQLATELRGGVEVRDRQYHLKNYKTCFVGSEAVDWMVASKWAETRAEAVRKGRLLLRYRYIHHVVDNHDFADSTLFFRYYADESKRSSYKFWVPQTAEERAADPLQWRFEPHTIANSLVLSVHQARALETACASAHSPNVHALFRAIRQRVVDCRSIEEMWTKSKRLSGDGVSVYRQTVDSAYSAIKTVFELEASADVLQRTILDTHRRHLIEPYTREMLFVDQIGPMQSAISFLHNESFTETPPEMIRRSSQSGRSTTPPPRLPSQRELVVTASPKRGMPPPTPPTARSIQPRRVRTVDEEGESDSDEELLSEKLSRVVHRIPILKKVFGSFVPEPQRPTLKTAALRTTSMEGSPRAMSGLRPTSLPKTSSPSPTPHDVASRSPAARAASSHAPGTPDSASSNDGRTMSTASQSHGSESVDHPHPLPAGARIVYKETSPVNNFMKSRDYVLLQDFFRLRNGTRVVYEMSVEHRKVPPHSKHVRGEVMLFACIIEPIKPKDDAASTDAAAAPAATTAPTISAAGEATDAASSGEATGEAAADASAAESEAQAGEGEATVADAAGAGAVPEPVDTKAPAATEKDSSDKASTPKNRPRVKVTVISQLDPHISAGSVTRLVHGGSLVDYQSRWLVEKMRSHFETNEEETTVQILEGVVPKDRYKERASAEGTDTEDTAKPKSVGLSSFDLLAVLGRGGYGKVMMVRHKDTGAIYAMKVLRKKDLVARKQVGRTMVEREILSNISHPFIVGMQFAFQTPAKLYMVIDYVSGGDFFTLLSREGCVNNSRARLYMAELCLAVNHLHQRGIVYRDLKPENVLLDGEGHVMLTDFGLSRLFESSSDTGVDLNDESKSEDGHLKVSHSFCGTEQYMAPEVLLQRGHNHTVDYWCLGILLSEMLTGRHPFKSKQHMQTLRNIVNPSVRPATARLMKPAAANFMRALLQRDSSARLGSEECGGFEAVKKHDFFLGVDWDAVYHRRIKPEFVPSVGGKEDTSNFDTVFTREAAVDSRTSAEGSSGGLFGLFRKPAKKKKARVESDDGFRGFSYAAPDASDAKHQALFSTLREEEASGAHE